MTSHLLTPTHCSSATPNSITVHTKGIRPSFQQYTASTNVTITDYIPHSCEVTGTNNCIMYIRRGPNNHDLKTTYTRTIPSTHCCTLASEGAIGKLAMLPSDSVGTLRRLSKENREHGRIYCHSTTYCTCTWSFFET